MGRFEKVVRFIGVASMIFVGCVLVSAVLGLGVELLAWLGAGRTLESAITWGNNLPGMAFLDSAAAASGLSPAWLGFLGAMAILALLGFFRRRK